MTEQRIAAFLQERLAQVDKPHKIDFLESLHHGPLCPGDEHCQHERCPIFRMERELLWRAA